MTVDNLIDNSVTLREIEHALSALAGEHVNIREGVYFTFPHNVGIGSLLEFLRFAESSKQMKEGQ